MFPTRLKGQSLRAARVPVSQWETFQGRSSGNKIKKRLVVKGKKSMDADPEMSPMFKLAGKDLE